MSSFCRVNPKTCTNENVSSMMSTFLIGPQFDHFKKKFSAPENFINVFTPSVWVRSGQNATDSDRS
jgi:hypothetical protein